MKSLVDITKDGVSAFSQGQSGGGSPDDPLATTSEVGAIAAGSTASLEQGLLASAGQVGKTILGVGYVYHNGDADGTPSMKAQIASLGAGNVVFHYASGADFLAGIIEEGPIFLKLGEIYIIQNVSTGSIITSSEGCYGFSQQRSGSDESPMPLLSLALAFKDTFMFGFRNCTAYRGGASSGAGNEGWIHCVNGPQASKVSLLNGAGAVVQGQEDIDVLPYGYLRLYTSGNQEYRIVSSNDLMSCHNAEMDTDSPRFYDSRLILPVTNDGITWPRSGQVSAPYNNTVVDYFVNDDVEGQFTCSPGSPVDFGAVTGATDADYEPRGATRVMAAGLISAYSGADSSGLEASPLCPVSTFTQRIALPLFIENGNDGGNNGIALASIYTGKARLYQWNQTTEVAELVTVEEPGTGNPVTEMLLQRRIGGTEQGDAPDREAQLHPASLLLSAGGGTNTADADAYGMSSDFQGGYIEVDVPCVCVFNSEQNENGGTDHTFKGTTGPNVPGIHSDDDEQLTYGITPEEIRAEIREGSDGRLYKRVIGSGGADSWVVA